MSLTWQEWKEKIGDRLHAIVDRALENSSVALYDQSLRDMQDYIRYVEEAAVSMKAAAEGNKRHLDQHLSEAEILETRLNQLLLEDRVEQAQRVQQALNIKRGQIAETQAQIERQEGQHIGLVHNWQTLGERLRVLQGERGSVVALVARAKVERAISSIEYTLGGLAGLGGYSEIGAMAAHIMQRLDEAEARLALVDVDAEVAQAAVAIEAARVEEQIKERRQRLGLAVEEVKEIPETPTVETQAPPVKEASTETADRSEDAPPEATPVEPEQGGTQEAEEPPAAAET